MCRFVVYFVMYNFLSCLSSVHGLDQKFSWQKADWSFLLNCDSYCICSNPLSRCLWMFPGVEDKTLCSFSIVPPPRCIVLRLQETKHNLVKYSIKSFESTQLCWLFICSPVHNTIITLISFFFKLSPKLHWLPRIVARNFHFQPSQLMSRAV